MRALATIGAALLLAGTAAAQSPDPDPVASLREIKDTTRIIAPWNLTVDQIEDREIKGPNGEIIADVDSVLEDANGEARAVIAEYGGYFGIGDTEVIVTLDQLKPDGPHLTTALTQDQLGALPAWSD